MINFLTDEDANVVIEIARRLTGTNVNRRDHSVIITNVIARILDTKCRTLDQYLALVDSDASESANLISALTIHTTGWFREIGAFRKLEQILNEKGHLFDIHHPFSVISAACSTGEEVYSLASLLENYKTKNQSFEYSIEGWDIDPICLRTARQATYASHQVHQQSTPYHSLLRFEAPSNYETKSMSVPIKDRVIVAKSLRDRCRFKTVNVVDPPQSSGKFNAIFCRNMLIYFDEITVDRIVSDLLGRLEPGGIFCFGVSETSAATRAGLNSLGQAMFELRAVKPDRSLASTHILGMAPLAEMARTVDRPTPVRDPILKTILPENGQSRAEKVKIMVVEDDHNLAEIMQLSLEEQDYAVTVCLHFQDAKLALARGRFSLILTDYLLNNYQTGLDLSSYARSIGVTVPIVLISGMADQSLVANAMSHGCQEVISKPIPSEELVRVCKSYLQPRTSIAPKKLDVILLGASTGGTEVLVRFLSNFPKNAPPIVVVQHIASEFMREFADRLAASSQLSLGRFEHGELLRQGTIYTPSMDAHIGCFEDHGRNLRLSVSMSAQMSGHRPSVDFLFLSAATIKRKVAAAIFTGMGKDGATGLLKLRGRGAMTFAQDEASSAVFGMPKEAIKLNAAQYVGSPDQIRESIVTQIEAFDPRLSKVS
ncbi:MAG: response regulator [Proteobacteria bacterium]|nr:response regulator [Pseudomonadota bacterium]